MPQPCLGIPHPQPRMSLEMPRGAPGRGAEGGLPEPRGSPCWWGGGGAGRGRHWERVPVPPAASQHPHMCAGSALHKGGSEALRSRAWRRHSPNGATGCGQLEPHGDGADRPAAAPATPPGTRTPPPPLPGSGARLIPGCRPGTAWVGQPRRRPPKQPAAPPGLHRHVACPVARVPRRVPAGSGAGAVPCLAWGRRGGPSPALLPHAAPYCLASLAAACSRL